MPIRVASQLHDVSPDAWNALVEDNNPFLRHEFLTALERHGCVGEAAGWLPQHLLAENDRGELLGAVPLYLKDNSFGEFVFDWGWADAYRRHGVDYYPKLVCALPFTPATGQRLLLAQAGRQPAEVGATAAELIDAAKTLAAQLKASSLHWLFLSADDAGRLDRAGFMTRLGCHFHWHNRGYREFADFSAALVAKKTQEHQPRAAAGGRRRGAATHP